MEKERRKNVVNFLRKSIEVFKTRYLLYFKNETIYLSLTKNA